MNKQHKKQSGFTIIEVVLVLAIAGLIFLMVFIALPSLQRGQRDDQRKRDLGRVKVDVNNYMAANRGNIPNQSTFDSFKTKYLVANEYNDPQGGEYQFKYDQNGSVNDIAQIVYSNGKICGADGAFENGKARDFAIAVKLESQQVPFCLDSR